MSRPAESDHPRAAPKRSTRQLWFQIHKWIGLLLAIAILPIAVSGALLVWHDALDEAVNPQRVASGAPALPVAGYAAAATAALRPGEVLMTLDVPAQGAVRATAWRPAAGKGRPVRTLLWLAPDDARLLDRAASDAGLVRFLHILHGSLFIPEWGRPIVGWVGVALLLSSMTGLWLWWPSFGGLRRGLAWRRQGHFDGNLHHQAGFWVALPLFVLSLTGAWISFPKVFSAFDAPDRAAGAPAVPGAPSARPEPSRQQRMRAKPMAAPAVDLTRALALAQTRSDAPVVRVSWPTDVEPEWTIATGPEERDRQTEIRVDAGSGAVTVEPPKLGDESLSRLMRRVHDGDGMGMVWQTIIALGGILPAILAVTGITMWWRTRRWRGKASAKRAPQAG